MRLKRVVKNPLVKNLEFSYGTKAIDIYDSCCEVFNWSSWERSNFGMQKPLWKDDVTPEGYDAWFLCHNNFTNTTNYNKYNKIDLIGNKIEEIWFVRDFGLYEHNNKRVTFAKMDGDYVFLGVYKVVSVKEEILSYNVIANGKVVKSRGEKVWVKTFKQISDTYKQN